MSRRQLIAIGIALGFAGLAAAQQNAEPKPTPSLEPAPQVSPQFTPEVAPQEEQGQLPPEEDKARLPKEYSFNPLQSAKELTVGEFYFKKGDFKAASTRFREATQWNGGNAEAWLRLGEASEKNHAPKEALEAYMKYADLAPAAKNLAEIRKRIDKLKH